MLSFLIVNIFFSNENLHLYAGVIFNMLNLIKFSFFDWTFYIQMLPLLVMANSRTFFTVPIVQAKVMHYLRGDRSLINKKSMSLTKWGTWDVETFIDKDNRIQAYMIGVYTDLDGFRCFYKLPRDISQEDGSKASSVSLDFIEYVSQSKFKNYSFFAHNFARFDFVFIVNAICELLNTNDVKIRSNHMRILSVSVNSIKFVDSLNYIPMTLNEAGVAFKEEKKQLQNINIARVFTDTLDSSLIIEIIKYNRQDCQMLFKILNNLQNISISKFSLNILKYATLPSFSFGVFKKTADLIKNKILVPDRSVDLFIRTAYRGGRVEIFKPYVIKNKGNFGINYVDFKSLYPAVALTEPMPGGYMVNTTKFHPEKLGIYLCEVTFLNPNKIIPYLSVLIDHQIYYPQGNWIATYTSVEINKAISLGYTLECLGGIIFDQKIYPFDGYFSKAYRWKEAAEQQGNMALRFVVKLLLNSLTGRFARKTDKFIDKIVASNEELQTILEQSNKGFQLTSRKEINLDYNLLRFKTTTHDTDARSSTLDLVEENVCPQVSVFITAYGRDWLYNILVNTNIAPIYCDTDSLIFEVVNKTFSMEDFNIYLKENSLKRIFDVLKLTNLDVGTLASVLNGEDIIEVVCLAKKFYLYRTNNAIHLILKGIKQDWTNLSKNEAEAIWAKCKEKLKSSSWASEFIFQTDVSLTPVPNTINFRKTLDHEQQKNYAEMVRKQITTNRVIENGIWIYSEPITVKLKPEYKHGNLSFFRSNISIPKSWFTIT